MHAGLGRLHRVVLVVDRRGRAGKIVNFIDFQIERKGHVVAHEFETRMPDQALNVLLGAGEEVVGANDIVAIGDQAIAQMRAEEASASCYKN
jgi:hypothetical protein